MTDRNAPLRRRELNRGHSNFATKTATDEGNQLGRRWSLFSKNNSPSPQTEARIPIANEDGQWDDFDGSHGATSSFGAGALSRIKAYFGLSSESENASAWSRRRSGTARRDSEEPLLATATAFDYRATSKRRSGS